MANQAVHRRRVKQVPDLAVSNSMTFGIGGVLRLFMAASLAIGLLLLADQRPASAEGGLVVKSETTYTVDDDLDAVRVHEQHTITNVTRDRRRGNYIEYFFYNRFNFFIPNEAQDLTITSRGGTLTPRIEEDPEFDGGDFGWQSVGFSNLRYNQTRVLEADYLIPSGTPRGDSLFRSNGAYHSFGVFTTGDPGLATVRLRVSPGMVVESIGDDLKRASPDDEGYIIYEAVDIDEPRDFWTYVTVRDDDELVEAVANVEDYDVVVKAWPDDTEWLETVTELVEDGLPVLEEAIGQPWPVEGQLTITEASTPYLYGYAGWYDTSNDNIEIGESLDAEVTLHELGHAWFNRKLFNSRWINEGLTEEFAHQGLVALELDEGRKPDKPTRSTLLDLNSWDAEPLGEQDEERESYAYNASWWVIHQIATEDGGKQVLRDVVDAAANDHISYLGEGEPDLVHRGPDNWRRLLDLLEERGSTADVEGILREHVVVATDFPKLDDRADARTNYQTHVEAGGEWAASLGLRRAMNDWNFELADEFMADEAMVHDIRNERADKADSMGLQLADSIEVDFQAVTKVDEFQPIADRLRTEIDSLDAIASARARLDIEPNLLTQVGLWGEDPEVLYSDATKAFEEERADDARSIATSVDGRMDEIEANGKARILKTAAGVLGGLLLLTLLIARRRRRRRKADAAAQQVKPHPDQPDQPEAMAEPDDVSDDETDRPFDEDRVEPVSA